jgi:ferredoxin-thioredoxin reductase catalytic subunit
LTTLEKIRRRAENDAKSSGCYLNPDAEILKDLFGGLKRNEERYGYISCPCRLASGRFEHDRDILCPCDYRDADVLDYGACYCTLYVRADVFEGKTPLSQVPERRPLKKQIRSYEEAPIIQPKEQDVSRSIIPKDTPTIRLKFLYCKQCGYICYREEPPYLCPICKANQELFDEITQF